MRFKWLCKKTCYSNCEQRIRFVARQTLFWALLITIIATTTYARASTYLPLDDEVYEILNRLEAEGIIHSGLLTSRPLSRKEIVRLILEAERKSEDRSPFIQSLVKSLKERFKDEISNTRFIKPVDNLYGKYVYSDSMTQELNYNSDGDTYKKGSNLRLGFSSKAELDWLSFYIHPELRYSEYGTEFVMKKGYGVLSFLGLDLQLGKDSQWWGPGYHGAILISNNEEPLTILKLTNTQPVLLPWVFRYLGPFRFLFFASRLEEGRKVAKPYLWGLRFNFKPIPYVEIGLERTAMLGGEGRSEGLATWWKSFTGKGENESGKEAGDQRAGGDIKVTLPFKVQPIQLYLEACGEDEAGGLPSRWAYLGGIYLPRILELERVALRVEYARTLDIWYRHHIYQSGYTYKGRIIGHHMGTDSKDYLFEISYLMPHIDGRLSFFYNKEEHNLSEPIREKKDEFALKAGFKTIRSLYVNVDYKFAKIKNFEKIPGNNRGMSLIIGTIGYEF